MNRAILLLKKRINSINKDIKDLKNIADNPELLIDYEFSINAIGNHEIELIELKKAIEILYKSTK